MIVNTDINVLGSLPNWNLVEHCYYNHNDVNYNSISSIKTNRSVKRFIRAIQNTLLKFPNSNVEVLFDKLIGKENISNNTLIFLFWNASYNNELLRYLNDKVFFPAFYSGRFSVSTKEVVACLKDLKQEEPNLRKWSDNTIRITASKYLTLLKKFGLMEGRKIKKILHPYLDDRLLTIFVYWLISINDKSNLLKSPWLKYSFTENQAFIERLTTKQLSRYIDFFYTGDNLKIEPKIGYDQIYENITRN